MPPLERLERALSPWVAYVIVPTFAVAGKPLRIPFSIDSALPRDEVVGVTMTTSTPEVVANRSTPAGIGAALSAYDNKLRPHFAEGAPLESGGVEG